MTALVASAALAGAAAAQPQLEVRVDNQIVATNFQHLFADTVVGEQAGQLVVVMRNIGNDDLVFSENPPVQLGGGFPDSFVLIQPALETGGKLSPNGSTAFAVRFIPQFEFANLNTDLFIFTNAAATPFHIQVRGRGLAPLVEEPNMPVADEEEDEAPADDEIPVDDEEIAEDPNDVIIEQDPNQAVEGDEELEQEGEDDFENEEDFENEDEVELDDFTPILPGGMCGFGVGFASLASLMSLTGARCSRRALRR